MSRFATTIHSYLFVAKDRGATVEEIAHRFGFTPQLVGDTLAGLHKEQHVVPTTETRDTGLLPGSPVWRAA